MFFKECYVSKNGISCITNINTLHNLKEITFNNIDKINLKNNILFYMMFRFTELCIKDFLNNKHYLNNISNSDDDFLLSCIIFN
jgi:hypothetical protein